MNRMTEDEFWRVESEFWGDDSDEQGYYTGTAHFLSGTSTPYPTQSEAYDAALDELRRGAWVRVTHYPARGFEES